MVVNLLLLGTMQLACIIVPQLGSKYSHVGHAQ